MIAVDETVDLERRFGGLRRLYGDAAYARIRAAHFVIVGVGGVGSWCAEALARSGVAGLTLIDLDHVSESNINRQIQATSATIGQAKVLALRDRIQGIHPGCDVNCIEEFVDEANWAALMPPQPIEAVVDACDQVRAKTVLAAWALNTNTRSTLVIAGAAGGKRQPHAVQVDDLGLVTHDPLLASLRQRLRKQHGAARSGKIGVRCVFSREAVIAPSEVCEMDDVSDAATDNSLNCHGYGSSVGVTATFGMVLASLALESAAAQK